jgi:hypothetical protein
MIAKMPFCWNAKILFSGSPHIPRLQRLFSTRSESSFRVSSHARHPAFDTGAVIHYCRLS